MFTAIIDGATVQYTVTEFIGGQYVDVYADRGALIGSARYVTVPAQPYRTRYIVGGRSWWTEGHESAYTAVRTIARFTS